MISDFKLIGLSKPNMMTCEPMDSDNIFWAPTSIPKERFDALFEYSKGNWKDKKIAEIEHNGINKDGTPINPMVISVREINRPRP